MRVRASCPMCGGIDIDPSVIRLVTYAKKPALDYYTFLCVGCNQRVERPADAAIVLALKDYVEHVQVDLPEEILECHTGGVITVDEVLDFMNEVLRWL